METDNKNWPIQIFTLGRFSILRDGYPIQFIGKVQRRPLELLKAIISFGGKEVPVAQITDILWPDTEGDMAHQSFNTTLYRLRRLISNDMAIKHQWGYVILDARYCWVDIWAFEQIFEKVEGFFKKTGGSENESAGKTPDTAFSDSSVLPIALSPTEAVRLAEKAISMYKGAFLPADTRYLWTMSLRERVRNKFIRIVIGLCDYLEQTGQWQQAVDRYQKVIEIDDLVEEFYQHLMVCHHHLGQKAEVVKVYNRCRAMLSAALGITPSPKTETIYNDLVRKIP